MSVSFAVALVELALDGNAAAAAADYRSRVVGLCRGLRHLDLRRLTDEERARVGEGWSANGRCNTSIRIDTSTSKQLNN